MTETKATTEEDIRLLGYYTDEGIKCVRLNDAKKPRDPEWQLKHVPLRELESWVRGGGNIGWQCGEVSGWIAGVDLDWLEARALAPRFLPDTLRGAKGQEAPSQYIYRSVGLGYAKFAGHDNSEIVSIKASSDGKGHQIAVAPSVHQTKGPYRFVGGYNPAAIAEVDQDRLARRVAMLSVAALVARLLPELGRHSLAMALAGYMLRNGAPEDEVSLMLVEAWEHRGAPREGIEDVRRIVRDTSVKLGRNEPATGGRTLEELMPGGPARIARFLGWERADTREVRRHYIRSDLGNADRFVDMHGTRVRWCPALKSWMFYDGWRWARDECGEARKLAHETARSIYKDAASEEDPTKQREIAKFAVSSQNEGRVNGMLSQAQPYLAVRIDDLDRDRWALNCQNGTLDLRTGNLRPHDPADLITRLAPVDYDPDAECPRFMRFLKETLIDGGVISFIKRYAGYTLTGITRERLFAILHGFGKNGKTTLVELLQDAMGDYATNTDTETILAKKYQGVGNEVAALKGARFVSAAEVEKGRRLAESKIKQLTGSDTVTARFLFGEPFNFRPEFKLWLSTNNKPVVLGTDDAIWDRIRLISFTQRFEGNKADPKLPEKLREELSGILAWMVEGCLEWQEHGLEEPDSVISATEQYRTEMDTLATFLDERCVIGEGFVVLAEQLYQQYTIWCDKSGERKEPQKAFVGRLTERGFVRARATRGVNRGRYIWRGIGLRHNDTPPDPDAEGSQREPKSGQGSHKEYRTDKPNSADAETSSESSEAKNQNPQGQNSRDGKVSDFGFTGFTGFTQTNEPPCEHGYAGGAGCLPCDVGEL